MIPGAGMMLASSARRVSFEIVGAGGQGGQANLQNPGANGGDGQIVRFDVTLERGTVLDLVVGSGNIGYSSAKANNHKGGTGGTGIFGTNGANGGNGGQASVVYLNGIPWAGAGAGGGGGGRAHAAAGGDGQATHIGSGVSTGANGQSESTAGAGGGGGGGGISSSSNQQGGAGGTSGGPATGGHVGGTLTPFGAGTFTGVNNNSSAGAGGAGGSVIPSGVGSNGQNGRITTTVDGVQHVFNYTGSDQTFTIP
ncbi:hypothetical protein [Arenibaculum pallidiluteum]|uniref:hypothetical protein n=1 Tax=Arenibaculum pallidiluteum TaxID=2812559 RepID=UPI001A9783F4|nr:hypothetical protein [Arenibaculum pallidiluteum]